MARERNKGRICGVTVGDRQCDRPAWAKGYCNNHYKQIKYRGEATEIRVYRPFGLDGRDLGRWCVTDGATTQGPGNCRNWKFAITGPNGYPTISALGRRVGTHRLVAWTFHTTDENFLKPSDVVHHMCHNKLCLNPDHLQITTHTANIAESLENQRLLEIVRDIGAELSAANDTIIKLKRKIDGI